MGTKVVGRTEPSLQCRGGFEEDGESVLVEGSIYEKSVEHEEEVSGEVQTLSDKHTDSDGGLNRGTPILDPTKWVTS